MSFKHHFKLLAAVAIMSIGALSMQANNASAIFGKKCVDQTGCPCFTCPSCRHKCNLESELVETEKICFEIEEKVICIPRVVFPWQKNKQSCCGCTEQPCSNCTHNGAKTRKICVLKPKKYTCPECEYTWSPQEKNCIPACGCSSGGCASSSDCPSSGCTGIPCDSAQLNLTQVDSQYEVGGATQEYSWNADEPIITEMPDQLSTNHAPLEPLTQPK